MIVKCDIDSFNFLYKYILREGLLKRIDWRIHTGVDTV
jgi:hypothetical protein